MSVHGERALVSRIHRPRSLDGYHYGSCATPLQVCRSSCGVLSTGVQYQCRATCQLQSTKATPVTRDMLKLDSWDGILTELQEHEAACDKSSVLLDLDLETSKENLKIVTIPSRGCKIRYRQALRCRARRLRLSTRSSMVKTYRRSSSKPKEMIAVFGIAMCLRRRSR